MSKLEVELGGCRDISGKDDGLDEDVCELHGSDLVSLLLSSSSPCSMSSKNHQYTICGHRALLSPCVPSIHALRRIS